jgi:hypothetical protein
MRDRRERRQDGAVVLNSVRRKQKDDGNLNIGYDVITDKY